MRLLELAGRANEISSRSEAEGRRSLLRMVIDRATWQEGQLEATFRRPFDLILARVAEARSEASNGTGKEVEPASFRNIRTPSKGRFRTRNWR